jgi:hypothetical protein
MSGYGHRDDGGVVDEAVDDGDGHGLVLEGGLPLAEGLVAGVDEGSAFVGLGDEFEADIGLVLVLAGVADGNTLPGALSGTGVCHDTDRVPDAARISPPVLLPGQRTGHDVSIHMSLDAGLAIRDLVSANHQVAVERPSTW